MPFRRLKSILLWRTNSCPAERDARDSLRSAPCSSSHLEFLKHWGKYFEDKELARVVELADTPDLGSGD